MHAAGEQKPLQARTLDVARHGAIAAAGQDRARTALRGEPEQHLPRAATRRCGIVRAFAESHHRVRKSSLFAPERDQSILRQIVSPHDCAIRMTSLEVGVQRGRELLRLGRVEGDFAGAGTENYLGGLGGPLDDAEKRRENERQENKPGDFVVHSGAASYPPDYATM